MNIKTIKVKFISVLVLSGIVFNACAFIFDILPEKFYLTPDFEYSFNVAAAAANPINAVNSVMKDIMGSQDNPPCAGSKKSENENDATTALYGILHVSLSIHNKQLSENRFCFPEKSAGYSLILPDEFSGAPPNLAGILFIFMFLLTWLALLKDKDSSKVNRLIFCDAAV